MGIFFTTGWATTASFGEETNLAPKPLPEEVASLVEQLNQAPDCSIQYWNHYHHSGGVKKRKKRFIKKDDLWRVDEWESDGTHILTLCFDGEKYYCHRPTSPYLLVTPRAFLAKIDISSSHGAHPLIGALNFPFAHPGSYEKCKLPEVADRTEIEHALGATDVEEISDPNFPDQKRYRLEGPSLIWNIVLEKDGGGEWRVAMDTFRHKQNPDSKEKRPAMMPDGRAKYQSKRIFGDWQTFQLGSETLKLPGKIVLETRDLSIGGRLLAQGNEDAYLIPESVQATPPDLPIDTFRVPLSVVRDPVIMD